MLEVKGRSDFKGLRLSIPIGQTGSGVKIEDLDENALAGPGVPLDEKSRSEIFGHLIQAISDSPEAAMKELVQIAVDYCHADSAGISLEEESGDRAVQFRWVAVAGSFQQYLNGTTPRFYSPCGTCVDRGVAQRYQVTRPYYNFLGVTAEPINDGLLIPWRSASQRGTLWLVSHHSENTFSKSDFSLMRRLAQFVSAGIDLMPKGNVAGLEKTSD